MSSATKGLGRIAPVDWQDAVEWQDAGEALDNDDLKGCLMPKGPPKDIAVPGDYLQYNEVCHLPARTFGEMAHWRFSL